MKNSLVIGSALVVILMVSASPAHATTYTWLPTSGGLFDTPGNWSPGGLPSAIGDITIFNSTATQTVIFQTNKTVGTHNIENGNITFQLNQTNNTMTSASGLTVGNIATQTGRLTILNGKLTGDMSIGDVDAATGFFTIGADAREWKRSD